MRIGLVARCDNSGLGTLSTEFYENLPITKVLTVFGKFQNFPERFKDGIICQHGIPALVEIDEFLKDIDIVLAFETSYNWNIFSKARERGIKTALMVNHEWTTHPLPVKPDLLLCFSKLDYDWMKQDNPDVKSIYIPMPINREKFPFKLRKVAKTFLFNNGHGGVIGRNGLIPLMDAISLTTFSDIKFIIHSQVPPPWTIRDHRVQLEIGEIPQEELYSEGDIFMLPHKYDGLSLPIQEAMSSGMPVITPNIHSHNTYLPKEFLFEPEATAKVKLGVDTRTIDMYIISPKILANKIEQWANQDITKYSKMMNKQAEKWSWANLKQKYLDTFEKLCKK